MCMKWLISEQARSCASGCAVPSAKACPCYVDPDHPATALAATDGTGEATYDLQQCQWLPVRCPRVLTPAPLNPPPPLPTAPVGSDEYTWQQEGQDVIPI
jgi:hypothetical protein